MPSGSLRRVLQLKMADGAVVGEEPMIFDQELPSLHTILERDGGRYRVLDYDPPHQEGDREIYVAKVERVDAD